MLLPKYRLDQKIDQLTRYVVIAILQLRDLFRDKIEVEEGRLGLYRVSESLLARSPQLFSQSRMSILIFR